MIGPGGPIVRLPSAFVTNSTLAIGVPSCEFEKVQLLAMSVMPVAEIWEMLSWSDGKDRPWYRPLAGKVEVYEAGPPVKVIVTRGGFVSRRESPRLSGEALERVARAERNMVVVYISRMLQGYVLFGLEQ